LRNAISKYACEIPLLQFTQGAHVTQQDVSSLRDLLGETKRSDESYFNHILYGIAKKQETFNRQDLWSFATQVT